MTRAYPIHGGPMISRTAAAWSPVLCILAERLYKGTYESLIARDDLVNRIQAKYPILEWMNVRVARQVLRAFLPEPWPRLCRPGYDKRQYCWLLPDEMTLRHLLAEEALRNSQVHLALYGFPLDRRPSFRPEQRSLGEG